MTSEERRLTAKGQRTRAAILQCGKLEFAESGYVRASMTNIAQKSGMSLGAIYRYFPDKEAIFSELFEELHARFLTVTRTTAPLLDMSDLQASIESATQNYFRLYAFERDFMGAVVEASATNDDYMTRWASMHHDISNRFVKRLYSITAVASSCQALERTVFALVCMTEQVAYVNLSRRRSNPSVSHEELATTVSDIWWSGIMSQLAD